MSDNIDEVGEHEERMELFYAELEDRCPGGLDPLILKELIDDGIQSDT